MATVKKTIPNARGEKPTPQDEKSANKTRHSTLVVLCGRLTADPELRYSTDLAICNIRVACNVGKTADFFSVVTFRQAAEKTAQAFKKGDEVAVQGKLHTSRWEQGGVKRERTEIIASVVDKLA